MTERDWTVMTEAEIDLAVLRGEISREQEDRMDARADALARARRAINDLADLGGSCPYESEHDELATHQKELFADIKVDRWWRNDD